MDDQTRELIRAEIERRGIKIDRSEFDYTKPCYKYVPKHIKAFGRQELAMFSKEKFVLFGGQAGGGKTIAVCMLPLLYVHIPNFSALILRRTYDALEQPSGPLAVMKSWLLNTDAKYSAENKTFTFPSGAQVRFGHCATKDDWARYQGGEYQVICLDELTMFFEEQYVNIISRLRRKKTKGYELPQKVFCTSNPGGIGHHWVKERFFCEETRRPDHLYVPSSLKDNPHIDAAEYEQTLLHLPPHRRKQLLEGDWDDISGTFFDPEWFSDDIYLSEEEYDNLIKVGLDGTVVTRFKRLVRSWDIAFSKDKGDWTVGTLIGMDENHRYYILDVVRFRDWSPVVKERILETAARDPKETIVAIEQSTGTGSIIDDLLLNGRFTYHKFDVSKNHDEPFDIPERPVRIPLVSVPSVGWKSAGNTGGAKLRRATHFINKLASHEVRMKRDDRWNGELQDELLAFCDVNGEQDDILDSVSMGFNVLMRTTGGFKGNEERKKTKGDLQINENRRKVRALEKLKRIR